MLIWGCVFCFVGWDCVSGFDLGPGFAFGGLAFIVGIGRTLRSEVLGGLI